MQNDKHQQQIEYQRKLTAHHEAGHAVMAILLGRNVHRVSIVPKQSRLGTCELKKDISKITKDPLEADALILFGGMVAEARISGRYGTDGARSDLINIERLALMRGGSAASAQRLAKRWLDKTEHLFNQAEHEAAIEAIAGQLLEREKISGRNAVHHFNEAIQRTKR